MTTIISVDRGSDVLSAERLFQRRAPRHDKLLEGAYFAAARSGEIEVTKHPERERVLRHILDNMSSHFRHPRLLTNPGPMWTFERRVEQELGEYSAYFVGIERSWQILEWGMRMMPGREKRYWEAHFNDNRERLSGYVTRKAMSCHSLVELLVHKVRTMDKEAHIGVFNRTNRKPRLHRKTYHQNFKEISGCWIDIWSPLGRPEIAMMLRHLPWFFTRARVPIPFAFTFQYGRDAISFKEASDPLEQRAGMIKAEMEFFGATFEVKDHWWYFGPCESRMATVCGIYRRKKKS